MTEFDPNKKAPIEPCDPHGGHKISATGLIKLHFPGGSMSTMALGEEGNRVIPECIDPPPPTAMTMAIPESPGRIESPIECPVMQTLALPETPHRVESPKGHLRFWAQRIRRWKKYGDEG